MKINHALLTLIAAATIPQLAALEISIADFGLKPSPEQNATPVFQKAVDQLIEAGGGTLNVPKGTYHFQVDGARVVTDGLYVSNNQDDFPKWVAMTLDGAKNITIEGNGSEFIFHHRMTAFHLEKAENITFKNISIDYSQPIHTDSTLIARDSESFIVEFVPGANYQIDDQGKFSFIIDGEPFEVWGSYVFEGETGRSKYQIAERGSFPKLSQCKAVEIKPGTVKFEGKPHANIQVGDRITHRHNNRNHVTFFIHQSKDTTLENITIHHACAMGVLGQRSENITIDRFRMAPKSGTEYISTAMADATHFSGCKGLIKVTNSHFQGMLDDAINVHGTSLRITEIPDRRTIVAKFMHHQSKGFPIASPGDEIRLIDNRTLLSLDAKFHCVAKAEPIDVEHVRITFEADLPENLQPGHAIENITWTPEVHFANNTIRNNRARGALFNTPRKCIVENNLIRTAGSAILVAGDANGWFESGAVGEFGPTIIRNNTFEDCLTNMFQFCRAIISIDPEIPAPSQTQAYHRDIRIENNHFKVFDAPLVFAKSVDGITITGNTFERTETFKPWHANKSAFSFTASQNITIKDNKVIGELLSTTIELKDTASKEVTLAPDSMFTK